MKLPVHYGRMEDGKLHCQSLRLALAELDGEAVEFTVCKAGTVKRSNPQNDYMHWMFQFIADKLTEKTGEKFTKSEVKEWLKYEELRYERPSPDGEVMTMMKGTSDLSKEEATHFIDRCIRRMSKDHKIIVPLPGEQMQIAA